MIDTIRLKSTTISEETAKKVENNLIHRSAIDRSTGEILYEFTNGQLVGSYDSRISVQVKREEWRYSREYERTVLSKCPPYLIIECSLHKIVLGHNVAYGSGDIIEGVSYLMQIINSSFGICLKDWKDYEVHKIDYTLTYDLGHEQKVKDYLFYLKNANYSRRKVHNYDDTGLYIKGSTTTVKFYHKGEELKKHDKKKVIMNMGAESYRQLQMIADKMLRIEVSIRKRKLLSDLIVRPRETLNKYIPLEENNKIDKVTVKDISEDYLLSVWEKEVFKLLKEDIMNSNELKTVKKTEDVRNRLFSMYSKRLANTLLGVWFNLSTFGEKYCKDFYAESSFRRYKKKLVDINISWQNTDVVISSDKIIEFTPSIDIALNSGYNRPSELYKSIVSKRLAS